MDVLRKELNQIYSSQHLENEVLDAGEVGISADLAVFAGPTP